MEKAYKPTRNFKTQIDHLTRSADPSPTAIMDTLLDFASFAACARPTQPDPFDDPYVAAALFTHDFRVIGAYRKQRAGQRHSEPEAIIQALGMSADPAASEIISSIDSAYEKKSWLQGPNARSEFELLFKRAGDFLRQHFSTEHLILFSSLEPCGQYEQQPSCSHIISACGIEHVYYGSDDINPKGLGRPVLLESGVTVSANISPQKAVGINEVYFAAAKICRSTFSNYSYNHLFSGSPHSLFVSDGSLFSARHGVDGRISIETKTPLSVQYAGSEHSIISRFITKTEESAFSKYDIADHANLFYGGDSLSELSKILYQYALTLDNLPRRLILTGNPFTTALDSEKPIADILQNRIIVNENAFRRQQEMWKAYRYLLLANFRGELRDHIGVIVKSVPPGLQKLSSSPYSFLFGSAEDLGTQILRTLRSIEQQGSYVARVTMIAGSYYDQRLTKLLDDDLRPHIVSGSSLLQRASLEVALVAKTGDTTAANAQQRLQNAINHSGEHNVQLLPVRYLTRDDTAAQLDADIQTGRRDPHFFAPVYINELARSLAWTERKYAGTIFSRLAASSKRYAEVKLLSPLENIATNRLRAENWTECCSRLNAVRNAAATLRLYHDDRASSVLHRLAMALARNIESDPATPWIDDVIWRWLASWFVLSGPSEMPSILATRIRETAFLLASAVDYALQSPLSSALNRLAALLAGAQTENGAKAAAIVAARRLTRDAGKPRENDQRWLRLCRDLHPQSFNSEFGLSETTRSNEFLGLVRQSNQTSILENSKELKENAQAYLRNFVAHRVLSGELGALQVDVADRNRLKPFKTWRQDHRQILSEVFSYLPRGWRPAALRAIARDVDVSLRWAALYLALNSDEIAQGFGEPSPKNNATLSAFRAEVVDLVRSAGEHYWIEREVIRAFLDSHSQTKSWHQNRSYIDLGTFPSASRLGFGKYWDCRMEEIHPEVAQLAQDLKQRSRRILLILPPIRWPGPANLVDGDTVAHEGSPPLGLGQISAALAAAGHYVEVIDAHRYAYGQDELARKACDFDYVGVSTVFSTVTSTKQLTQTIVMVNTKRPIIVIGGHAATLGALEGVEGLIVDHLVVGPGERAFVEIVDESPYKRTNTSKETRKGVNTEFGEIWSDLPLIDRRVFSTPAGSVYEPAATRNGSGRECHIVLSKGCDWHCSFCTEAVLGGDGPEVRRKAESVIGEIEFIRHSTGANHVQFIDDNVLPPIAAPGLAVDEKGRRLKWSEALLTGLKDMRDGDMRDRAEKPDSHLSWRGLFRLEDFVLYEQQEPLFLDMLAESGCSLLAFGIEHGSARVRMRLKGKNGWCPTNQQIFDMVKKLKSRGIASKGYFMIGGQHDTPELAEETIDFALRSRLDLAYFAIYKDFRSLVKGARAETSVGSEAFDELEFDLGEIDNLNEDAWGALFGSTPLREDNGSYVNSVKDLKAAGFEFASLFKYADYHQDSARESLYFGSDVSCDDLENVYFQKIRKAYLEFYARPEWVHTYKKLIARRY